MHAAGSSTPLGHPRRLVIHAARSSMPLGHSWTFAACQRQHLCRTPAPLPHASASDCCARGTSRVPRTWVEACGRVFAHSSRASRAPGECAFALRGVCITETFASRRQQRRRAKETKNKTHSVRWEWEGKGRKRERGKCPPQTPSRYKERLERRGEGYLR